MTACKSVHKHIKESMETLKFEGDAVESPVKEKKGGKREGEEEGKYELNVKIARTK